MRTLRDIFNRSYKEVTKAGKIAVLAYISVLVMASILDSLLLILLSKWMTDLNFAKNELSFELLIATIVVLLGKPILVTYLNVVISRKLADEETEISSRFLKVAMASQWRTDEKLKSGEFLNLVTDGPSAIVRGILIRGCIAIAGVTNILVIFLTVLYIDAISSMIFGLYVVGVSFLANTYFTKLVGQLGDDKRFANEYQIDITTKGIALSKVLKLMNSRSFFSHFRRHRYHLSRLGAKSEVLSQLPRAFFEFFAGFLVVVLIVNYKYELGFFALNIVVFGAAAFRIMPLMSQIQAVAIQMSIEKSNAEQCLEMMNKSGANRQTLNGIFDELDSDVIVELKNVSYRYKDSFVDALDCIDLTIREGESIAVIGISGSGKSTLLDLLNGSIMPSSGMISWNDGFIGKIGFLPQISVAAGIKLGNSIALEWDDEQIDKNRIDSLMADLKKLKLFDQQDFDQEKLDSELSVGQMQVIGLMRTAYMEPAFLILDEPTSALDAGSQSEVMALLKTMKMRGKIIVAHRLETIGECSRVICLESGRIIADGTYMQVETSLQNILNYIDPDTI